MSQYRSLILVACLAAPVAFAASGTTAASQQAAPSAYPTRDMTMQQVQARFGAPEQKMAPTPSTAQGPLKPPIIRWVYADFTVYFERNLVIHTVLTHPREAPTPETSG
ncbi:MAG: hypothetical protein ACRETC_10805 [Gammaproteobacteria bacterium]